MQNNKLKQLPTKHKNALFVFLAIALFSSCLQLLPLPWANKLRYSGNADLEIWRLFTGHFIHLGWRHFFLNLAGLLMIILLFPAENSKPVRMLTFYIFSSLFISLMFKIFHPELIWYVGLSGVLHALMVFCILENLPNYKTTNLLLLIGITGKVLHELFIGPSESSKTFIGGNIVYQAHAWGIVAGLLFFAGSRLFSLKRSASTASTTTGSDCENENEKKPA